MGRIIGPILALFGILAIIGVATGVAYTAGLNAAGVTTGVTAVTTTGATGTTTVVPVVGYGWYGGPGWGFGQFLFMLIGFFLIVALLRFAFGAGRHGRGWHGRGWYGRGWGPGYGHGPGGWDHHGTDAGADGPGGSGDPREAWIRGRLDEWHRTAHATPGQPGATGTPGTAPNGPTGPGPSGPAEPPVAG